MRNFLSAFMFFVVLLATSHVRAGTTIQPGFYAHEPEGIEFQMQDARSGLVCGATFEEAHVCETATLVTITGTQSCRDRDGNQQPCTRFGYEFNYSGAKPGEVLECQVERANAYRSESYNYNHELTAASGRVMRPSWARFQIVSRRTMLTEVHKCSLNGATLATIEFIITHEPGTPLPGTVSAAEDPDQATEAPAGADPNVDEPFISEVPNSCSDLTEDLAAELLQVDSIQASGVHEHVANLQSSCSYTAIAAPPRNVNFLYKFMPYAMYDVDTLSPMQLTFNATVTGGGTRPSGTIDDLGKITFVFETAVRTTLLVVTGIQGPMVAGEPRELVAFLYLEDAERDHDDRLEALLSVARDRLSAWR